MRTTRAGLALAAVLGTSATDARADGESSPMFGGSLIATRVADEAELAGVELEVSQWWWRLGVAVEGSRRWDIATGEALSTTVGASARLLVFDRLIPSLFEPRDVELGVELHAILERAWWQDTEHADSHGFGVAIRLRGGGDAWYSTLLAESRMFVRFMASRDAPGDALARSTMPLPSDGERSVVFGIGAAWGAGRSDYVDRFRLRWPDSPFLER